MVTITTVYEGSLRCTATHGPSSTTLSTDAPKDNQGRGESFSPTDLVATALATCALTIMAMAARREGVSVDGATATVQKSMAADPRRISALTLHISVPGRLTAAQKKVLEDAARHCPVYRSIHPDIDAPCRFSYPDET
jgi:putative redox protein